MTERPRTGTLTIDVGDRVCIRTDKGRLVFMEVLEREDSGWIVRLLLWKGA